MHILHTKFKFVCKNSEKIWILLVYWQMSINSLAVELFKAITIASYLFIFLIMNVFLRRADEYRVWLLAWKIKTKACALIVQTFCRFFLSLAKHQTEYKGSLLVGRCSTTGSEWKQYNETWLPSILTELALFAPQTRFCPMALAAIFHIGRSCEQLSSNWFQRKLSFATNGRFFWQKRPWQW